MTRTARVLLAALLALVLPALAAALDAPHDQTFLPNNCQECHQLHNALGTSLTSQVTISDACVTCHATHTSSRFGFPWYSTDQAVAGVSGAQHRWDATAINPAVGATAPDGNPEMMKRIIAGKLECSVCHNQHAANKGFSPPESMNVSLATSPPTTATGKFPTGLATGTGTLYLASSNAATAVATGYWLRVRTAGNVAASMDGGLTWWRPTTNTGAAWVADAAVPVGGPYLTTVDLALPNNPDLKVRFGGVPATDDLWKLFVSFPMLRSPNLSGAICLECHKDRAQPHAYVEVNDTGTKVFSHPVGEILNANTRGYDRGTPLDADGGVQGTNGDTNATNDMLLGPGGVVGCTSCHAPHNADSNSLTVDPR